MSKATETLDTTVASSMLAVIGIVFLGSLFASASPGHAPTVAPATAAYQVHEVSDGINITVSGGRLKK